MAAKAMSPAADTVALLTIQQAIVAQGRDER
jgi:hypothetical protein